MAGDDSSARRSGGPGPPAWPVCAVVGVSPAAGAALPSRQAGLLGYSDVTSCSGRAWRLGSAVASRADGHGPGQRARKWKPAAACGVWLFGEPLAAVAGEPWPGRVAKAPCWWPTFTVATHLLGTPFLPPLAGAVLILERRGRGALRIERLLNPLAPLPAPCKQLAGLASAVSLDCDDPRRIQRAAPACCTRASVLRERTADLGIRGGRLPVGP